MPSSNDAPKKLAQFADDLLRLPWGTLAKSELEFRVFQLMADTGHIKLGRSDIHLAQDLATTQAKIRALRYKSQQRFYRDKEEWPWDDLLSTNHVTLHSASQDGKKLILYAKDPFLKEVLTEKLREGSQPVLVQSTLTHGHLRVSGMRFWMKVLEDGTLSQEEYEEVQEKFEQTYPEEKSRFEELRENADKAAGAANIASFAIAFFSAVGKLATGN